MLQHDNINPALVVTDNEIPTLFIQAYRPLNIPIHFLCQHHPAGVTADPGIGNGGQNRGDAFAHQWHGNNDFYKGEDKQQRAPEHDVDKQQQAGNNTGNNPKHLLFSFILL